MTLSAIITTHNNRKGLEGILNNLFSQSVVPHEIIVIGSDSDLTNLPSGVIAITDQNHNDWGHNKREIGIRMASQDYIGFFNDDDSYHRDYVKEMLDNSLGMDAVYCGWNTYNRPSFSLGSSTSGNFIVNAVLAKEIGYPWRSYDADGMFINAIKQRTDKIKFVDKVLYFHNIRPHDLI